MALNGLDWVNYYIFYIIKFNSTYINFSFFSRNKFQGALFTPDTVEDCDGFDPEYFGEEEGEEEQVLI